MFLIGIISGLKFGTFLFIITFSDRRNESVAVNVIFLFCIDIYTLASSGLIDK